MSVVLLDTDDVGEAERLIGASYAKVCFHVADGRTHTRMVRSTIGSLTVDHFDFAYDFDYYIEPLATSCYAGCEPDASSSASRTAAPPSLGRGR